MMKKAAARELIRMVESHCGTMLFGPVSLCLPLYTIHENLLLNMVPVCSVMK